MINNLEFIIDSSFDDINDIYENIGNNEIKLDDSIDGNAETDTLERKLENKRTELNIIRSKGKSLNRNYKVLEREFNKVQSNGKDALTVLINEIKKLKAKKYTYENLLYSLPSQQTMKKMISILKKYVSDHKIDGELNLSKLMDVGILKPYESVEHLPDRLSILYNLYENSSVFRKPTVFKFLYEDNNVVPSEDEMELQRMFCLLDSSFRTTMKDYNDQIQQLESEINSIKSNIRDEIRSVKMPEKKVCSDDVIKIVKASGGNIKLLKVDSCDYYTYCGVLFKVEKRYGKYFAVIDGISTPLSIFIGQRHKTFPYRNNRELPSRFHFLY